MKGPHVCKQEGCTVSLSIAFGYCRLHACIELGCPNGRYYEGRCKDHQFPAPTVQFELVKNFCAGGCGKTIGSGDWFCHMRPCYESIKIRLEQAKDVEDRLRASHARENELNAKLNDQRNKFGETMRKHKLALVNIYKIARETV